MKIKLILCFFFFFILALICFDKKDLFFSFNNFSKSPIITKDIDRFWDIYETTSLEKRAEAFNKEYINKGTPGLQNFLVNRINDGQYLSDAIVKFPENYNLTIKERTKKIKNLKNEIQTSFYRLKEIYPQAVYPNVYFVIGASNSGGHSTEAGLIIGAEVAASSEESYKKIPSLVAHELIHYQQSHEVETEATTLLEFAIMEGGADFLGELISDKIYNTNYEYGEMHEKEIWEEFSKVMHIKYPSASLINSWFYGGTPPIEEAPSFLGYFVGYKICQAYYRTAEDKSIAIKNLLHMKNAEEILEQSNYLSPDA